MTHKAQTKAIPNPKPDSSIVSKGDGGLEIESEPEYTNIHRPLHGTRLVPPYCRKSTAAALIGNILEHYDSALYGFLAPILAPLFFPSDDLIISLMLAYALLPLGIISRIGGSLIFGRMGDKQGRKRALSLSIFGMAIITGSMGLLPTYDTVGMWAPAGLALCRILQGLFASGESLGGAQFLLEHHGEAKKGLLSSLYSASTILGILGASAAVVLLTYFSLNWRYLYGVGFMTGFAGIFLRLQSKESPEFLASQAVLSLESLPTSVQLYWREIFCLIVVSGYSYITYALSFQFINGFVPLVTSITLSELMVMNTLLLVGDMFLLPVFGFLADRYSHHKLMISSLLVSLIIAVPLFSNLEGASLWHIIALRTGIVFMGVWFSAPFHAWAKELFPVRCRYTLISLGYSIGTPLIGSSTSVICLWMWHETHLTQVPGLYWFFWSVICLVALNWIRAHQKSLTNPTG